MSEEMMAADANLAEIARLRGDVALLRAALAQAERAIHAEQVARRNAEADNAALIGTLEHAARMFTIKGARVVIHAALAEPHPGAQVLAELDAARAVVAAARDACEASLFDMRGPLVTRVARYDWTVQDAAKARNE